jgi:hypothetical protein
VADAGWLIAKCESTTLADADGIRSSDSERGEKYLDFNSKK